MPNTYTLSAAMRVSVLAHVVAIGALLMAKPVPRLAPTVEMIEISLVPDQPPRSHHPNDLSGNFPTESPVDVLEMPLLSLAHPDVMTTAPPSNWSGSLNLGHSFEAPMLPTFRPHTLAPGFDKLATALDCFAVGGPTRGTSGRSHRTQPPCASDDPALGAPMTLRLPLYASQPAERKADTDYRTFKPSQTTYYELFPDDIPQANRAAKSWIVGLFR